MMGMPGGWKPGSFWVRKVVQKPCWELGRQVPGPCAQIC